MPTTPNTKSTNNKPRTGSAASKSTVTGANAGTGPTASARSAALKSAAAQQKLDDRQIKLKNEYSYESSEAIELRNQIRSLNQSIQTELGLLNDSQQQTAKLTQFYHQAKSARQLLQLQLRSALRNKSDLDDRHSFELKLYKEKVKHLLAEQQSIITSSQYNNESVLKLLENSNRANSHQYELNNRELSINRKTIEVNHNNLIYSMKAETERSIMSIRLEYEQKADELHNHYEKQFKQLRDTSDNIRRDEINRLELKKNTMIAELLLSHKREFEKIKKYYSDITHANLELIKNLKEEVGDLKKKENSILKQVNEIKSLNRKLSKPLDQNKLLVESLKLQLIQYQTDRSELGRINSELIEYQSLINNNEWELEILQQKSAALIDNKLLLETELQSTAYEIIQKDSFRTILNKNKLSSIIADLEKTESALNELLISSNLNPSVLGNIQSNLESILIIKNQQIQSLNDSIDNIKSSYISLQAHCEEKLEKFQIPIQELGFQTIK